MKGVLSTECAEHPPFAMRVSLDQSRSRKEYAEHAGMAQEPLATALVDLCSARFEEIEAAAMDIGEEDEALPESSAEIPQEELDVLIGEPGVLGRITEAAATFSKVV